MKIQPLSAPLGTVFEWDGGPYIDGEEVKAQVTLADGHYIFTQSRMFVAEPKPEIANENGTLPPAGQTS